LSAAEWAAVAAVVVTLFIAMPLIRWLADELNASPEVARKIIHVVMGLSCASFPWLFNRPQPVWILALFTTLSLGLIRTLPILKHGIGAALHGIKRPSYGEILFAPAIAAVFTLARGNWLLFLIPILILTLADAAGALVGTRWGKTRYGSGEGFKSIEGSGIFLLTAFLCGFLPLLINQRVETIHALWIGLILAILATMAEGISDRGFDNLVLPVGCFFILEKLLTLEIPSLAGRFLVLGLLLGLVLIGSRWSTLSGGALLGSVLLGYGCAVIADWRFALPPVAVFICHIVITRKHRLTEKFDHRLDAVISHAIAGMPWVIAGGLHWISMDTALAGISFAMGTQLAILDVSTRTWVSNLGKNSIRSAAKGFLFATLPGLCSLSAGSLEVILAAAIAFACMWLIAQIFPSVQTRYREQITGLWIAQGLLALTTALPAFIIRS
jgi:phytol kinase